MNAFRWMLAFQLSIPVPPEYPIVLIFLTVFGNG
jgi:hypothetical protein